MEGANLAAAMRSALIGEIEQLRTEIWQATDGLGDEQLWRRPLTPGNSIGHLILHLTGNLNHFVGAQLGNTGYVREREREFTEDKVPPRPQLLKDLDGAVATFRSVVGGLTQEQLTAIHPTAKFGSVTATLVHLVAHFALHRGQISYIRRLVENS